jgi:hypothetical protein
LKRVGVEIEAVRQELDVPPLWSGGLQRVTVFDRIDQTEVVRRGNTAEESCVLGLPKGPDPPADTRGARAHPLELEGGLAEIVQDADPGIGLKKVCERGFPADQDLRREHGHQRPQRGLHLRTAVEVNVRRIRGEQLPQRAIRSLLGDPNNISKRVAVLAGLVRVYRRGEVRKRYLVAPGEEQGKVGISMALAGIRRESMGWQQNEDSHLFVF